MTASTPRATSRAGRRKLVWPLVVALVTASCSGGADRAPGDDAADTPSTVDDPAGTAPSGTDPGSGSGAAGGRPPPVAVAEPTDPDRPIGIDPDVRHGTLANGLTYYVRANDHPGGHADLRLAIDAGSVNEDGDQSGVAHFLEHMLFNGTERYPENELLDVLRGFGSRFGADINAFTSFDETVYQLTVPTQRPEAVELAVDVLAEWLSRATLADGAIEDERGVVLDEWRVRTQQSSGRIFAAIEDLFLTGTVYEGRSPIGDADAIGTMSAAPLRRFYDDWYRPDNAAVVVVGDVDVEATVALIAERFGGAGERAPARPQPDRTATPVSAPAARVHVDPDQTSAFVELTLPLPAEPAGDTGQLRDSLLDTIVFDALARRLQADVARGTAPFVDADPDSNSHVRGLDAPSLLVQGRAEDASDALEAIVTEFRRAELHGFSPAEVAVTTAALRARIETAHAGRETVQDAEYADRYTDHFLQGAPIPSAATEYELQTAILDTTTAEHVNWRFLDRWQRSAPHVLVVGPVDAELPSEGEVLAVVDEIAGTFVAARPAAADTPQALMAAPPPVVEVTLTRGVPGGGSIPFLAPTTLVFPNGATVVVNRTEIVEGAVSFQARSPGGTALLDDESAVDALWAPDVVFTSGVGDLDQVELERFLAASEVSLSADIGPYTDSLYGESATADLEVLFQLVHLYLTRPRFERAALDRVTSTWGPIVADPASDADVALFDAVLDARYGGDPRFTYLPEPAEFETLDLAGIEKVWRERMGDASDWVFAFSGDVDEATVRRLAQRYVGTLPGGRGVERPPDVTPAAPTSVVSTEVRAGSGERAALVVLSTVEIDDADAVRRVLADLTTEILSTRLERTVREELGESYSPFASITLDHEPDPTVTTLIRVSGAPDRIGAISSVVQETIGELRATGPTAPELASARAVIGDGYDLYDNEGLIDEVLGALVHPRRDLDWLEHRASILARVAPDEIRRFVANHLPADGHVEVTVVPREP